jgi:hypothetical protein
MCWRAAQSIMLLMFNDHLLRTLSRYRSEDARRGRDQVTPIAAPTAREDQIEPLTIRHAVSTDLSAIERLAALDSRRVPSGELFVAEVEGRLFAAVSVDTGAVIADPFEPTASIVDVLRLHAAATRPTAPRTPRARALAQAAAVN